LHSKGFTQGRTQKNSGGWGANWQSPERLEVKDVGTNKTPRRWKVAETLALGDFPIFFNIFRHICLKIQLWSKCL